MDELYKVDELKTLKEGDTVIVEFDHDEDGYFKDKVTVVSLDQNGIYFDCGMDFPFDSNCGDVETEYAVQDSGDYVFKVFKLN